MKKNVPLVQIIGLLGLLSLLTPALDDPDKMQITDESGKVLTTQETEKACIYGKPVLRGFFDLQHRSKTIGALPVGLSFGQFEVQVAVELNEFFYAEGSFALGEGSFEPGSVFFDFSISRLLESKGYSPSFENGLIVGQFDVPFGLDYRCMPSPNRPNITAPLINQRTINSWNDIGASLYHSGRFVNTNLFVLSQTWLGNSIGGRIGLMPVSYCEIGVSECKNLSADTLGQRSVQGLDCHLELDFVQIQGEYLFAKGIIDGELASAGNIKHSGYYLQALIDIEKKYSFPFYLLVRHGSWESDAPALVDPSDTISRFTAALGYRVAPGVEVRLEYLNQQSDDPSWRYSGLSSQLLVYFE